jgi:hypothetical protein
LVFWRGSGNIFLYSLCCMRMKTAVCVGCWPFRGILAGLGTTPIRLSISNSRHAPRWPNRHNLLRADTPTPPPGAASLRPRRTREFEVSSVYSPKHVAFSPLPTQATPSLRTGDGRSGDVGVSQVSSRATSQNSVRRFTPKRRSRLPPWSPQLWRSQVKCSSVNIYVSNRRT